MAEWDGLRARRVDDVDFLQEKFDKLNQKMLDSQEGMEVLRQNSDTRDLRQKNDIKELREICQRLSEDNTVLKREQRVLKDQIKTQTERIDQQEIKISIMDVEICTLMKQSRAHITVTEGIVQSVALVGIPLSLLHCFKATYLDFIATLPARFYLDKPEEKGGEGDLETSVAHRIWIQNGTLYTDRLEGLDEIGCERLLSSWDTHVTHLTASDANWQDLEPLEICLNAMLEYDEASLDEQSETEFLGRFACSTCEKRHTFCVGYDQQHHRQKLLPLKSLRAENMRIITRATFIRPSLKIRVSNQHDRELEHNHQQHHEENQSNSDQYIYGDHFDDDDEQHHQYISDDDNDDDDEADFMVVDT